MYECEAPRIDISIPSKLYTYIQEGVYLVCLGLILPKPKRGSGCFSNGLAILAGETVS